jgi:hypothetical protein
MYIVIKECIKRKKSLNVFGGFSGSEFSFL